MSLGDYLRFLRAMRDGPTPWEIQEATEVPSSIYRHLEQRYREMGDEDTIQKLAEYFEVPVEELQQRKTKYRKALSAALLEAKTNDQSIRLILRSGHTFEGRIGWWDLGATLVRLADGEEIVIQRHIVDDWQVTESN